LQENVAASGDTLTATDFAALDDQGRREAA
jgi:hypothetical protein